MTLRSEIRFALSKVPAGLLMQDLFEACESAEDEQKFRQNISVLKAEGKVVIASTTDEAKPKAIYGLGNWPEKGGGESGGKPPPAPKKKTRKANGHASPALPLGPDLSQIEAQFAINARGELGIEKGDTKLRLSAAEFEVLRQFVEKTEEVWRAAA